MTTLAHDLNLDWLTTSKGEPREYVSPSFLNKFKACPEQFRRHYVLHERLFTGSGHTVWGSADHEAIGWAMARKLALGDDGGEAPLDIVLNVFAAEVDRQAAEGEIEWKGKDFEGRTAKQNLATIKDKGTKLVAAYHEQVCPTIQPVAIEERFDIEVPGLPLRLMGYVDLRAKRIGAFGEGPTVIIERKTRSASRQKVAGAETFQGQCYQLACPEPVQFHFSVKTVTPKLVGCFGENDMAVAPTERTKALIWQTLVGISTCYSIYGPDDPWPDALLNEGQCDYRCSFKSTCPWWTT